MKRNRWWEVWGGDGGDGGGGLSICLFIKEGGEEIGIRLLVECRRVLLSLFYYLASQ